MADFKLARKGDEPQLVSLSGGKRHRLVKLQRGGLSASVHTFWHEWNTMYFVA